MDHPYFKWLIDMPGFDVKYKTVLSILFITDFKWILDLDSAREEDGIDLRYRFADEYGYASMFDILDAPCSCLEMIVALARRKEVTMSNPRYGDRTWVWMKAMLDSLGIYPGMELEQICYILDRWLNRQFEPTGEGSLFTIPDCHLDLRKVDIYRQSNLWFALMDD